MFGFYRAAAVVPRMAVADVDFNLSGTLRMAEEVSGKGAGIAVFPELGLTGYTCGDLFHQKILIDSAKSALERFAAGTASMKTLFAIGLPVLFHGRLYNAAAIVQRGRVLGLVPKTFPPNQREFYEKRHFASGFGVSGEVEISGLTVPFGANVIFDCGNGVRIGVELCEDLWAPMPPSQLLAVKGAAVILNLSASNALVSKSKYRRDLVINQSARCMGAYVYASSGVHESTTDTVFGGHAMIAENGSLIAENKRFERESNVVYGDIDIERIEMARITEGSFQFDPRPETNVEFVRCPDIPGVDSPVNRHIPTAPFVPGSDADRAEVCTEIFNIQTAGLAKRMEHCSMKKAVIGISGGLDSTLALLATAETFKMLGLDPSGIIAITMPGFGTTGRTKSNSVKLAELLKCDLRSIEITKACLAHFADIGHDPSDLSVTYENVQARERTQILMDVANREGGLVVGTGDLSEIALGWSTYNADHMSMYAVNCGVPKTLVRHLVRWVADNSSPELAAVLRDVVDTPVSPELLPVDACGKTPQKTESILGTYELHDFFLYHTVKYGAEPRKLEFLARFAFDGKYSDDEIKRALKVFVRRFFTQQFKRSCIPDGPKIGTIALSPRADWRMPSDASCALWLKELEK